MLVPTPPPVASIQRISPTVYEAARRCVARASWSATGSHARVPPPPRALLGSGAHAILERARRAGLPGGTQEEWKRAADAAFDEKVRALFAEAHPLLRAKFETVEHIPYFHIYRARTALIAARLAAVPGHRAEATRQAPKRQRTHIESLLTSRDGRVAGRPDVVDADTGTVVDYKTARVDDPHRVSDSEGRQLRLYAHLAAENGIEIRRGEIERAGRVRAAIDIPQRDAEVEGQRARDALTEYSRHVNRPFADAASPSGATCRYCPCIPFCPAFWEKSTPDWVADCGTHLEGTVESLDGESLLSLQVNVSRGTTGPGSVAITRLSRNWLAVGEAEIPCPGDLVRVTDARPTGDTTSLSVIRADRETTAVWRCEPRT